MNLQTVLCYIVFGSQLGKNGLGEDREEDLLWDRGKVTEQECLQEYQNVCLSSGLIIYNPSQEDGIQFLSSFPRSDPC